MKAPFSSRQIGNDTARFRNHQAARGSVPGLELELPETVKPSGGKIGQVQGRRARAPERLRFAIDPRWHGELPRTYLYDRAHVVQAVSGVIPPEQLTKWVKENVR